jgi:hypothetical protein
VQTKHPVSEDDSEQMVEAALSKSPTKAKWLLLQADKIRTSQRSRIVERLLLGIGALILMQIYTYVESGVLDMDDFVFFLMVFIIVAVGRCWQKCDKTEQQLVLISKAIRALNQPTDKGSDSQNTVK